MCKIRVVRVTRTEFETGDGHVFPIDPPLLEYMTPDEFQEHYDLATSFVRSLKAAGDNSKNAETVGHDR